MKCWPSSPRGFTLIELTVVIAILTSVAVTLLPAVQDARHDENARHAENRIRQFATAILQYHRDQGAFPVTFEELAPPYLEANISLKLQAGDPFDGLRYRLSIHPHGVLLESEVANPMRTIQTTSVKLDSTAVLNYAETGTIPAVSFKIDKAAVAENHKRLGKIFDVGVTAVMCESDVDEATALEGISSAWRLFEVRESARNLLDPDQDGTTTSEELFGEDLGNLFLAAPCAQAFFEFSLDQLQFDSDEPSYEVAVRDTGLWYQTLRSRLRRQTRDLGRIVTRSDTEIVQLAQSVDASGVDLRLADPSAAIDSIDRFEGQLGSLVNGGKVSQELATPALTTADLFQAALIGQLIYEPESPWGIEATRIYVDWNATGGDSATGMSDDPFQDLDQALLYAEQQQLPAVVILLQPGLYGGSFSITRNTKIVGSDHNWIYGEFVNHGPHVFEMSSVELGPSDDEHGGIRVRHPEAVTFLQDVVIANSRGFALHQSGGTCSLNRVHVERVEPTSATRGVAVQFDSGARVDLKDVELHDNRGGGLLLTGGETRVEFVGLGISQTRSNPYAINAIQEVILEAHREGIDYDLTEIRPGTAALDIGHEAVLDGQFLSVVGNEYLGLAIHDQGQAILYNTRVAQTRPPTQIPNDGFDFNIFVNQSELDMTVFTLSDSRAGLYLVGNVRPKLRGQPALITRCNVCVLAGGFDENPELDYLAESVSLDCAVNIRTDEVPVPSAVPLLPSE